MPETSMVLYGYRSSWESACLSAARIAKSPPPGHQVGFSSLLKSFMSDIGEYSLTHLARDLITRKWAAVVLQDLIGQVDARHHADHQRELAGVVVFDVDHPPGAVQELLG